MATNANHPLAVALDQRIRAVVNEAVAEALREQVGQILNEQLATLLGGKAPAAAKPAAKRGPGRPRKTETAARAAAAKPAAKRGPGRPRKAEGAAKAATKTAAAGAQKCEVVGCKRPYRSRGYCAAHYQAARKYGWPMPAPKNFEPPPRPSRGRPSAAS